MTPDKDLVAESCPRQRSHEREIVASTARKISDRRRCVAWTLSTMSDETKKLHLGENHRRVVSVLIRRVEAACDGILQDLDRRSSLLLSMEDDVRAEQDRKLRELVGKLHAEVARVASEVTLDPAVRSRRRSIAARISATMIDLEDVSGSALRGYGAMPQDAERTLIEKFARLIIVLQEMERIAEASE